MATEANRRRLNRDVVMVALALFSIALLAIDEDRLDPAQRTQLVYLDLAIVGVFWAEYLWRLSKVPQQKDRYPSRWEFVKTNWYELPGMVPILPGMEGLGGVRVLRLLRVLRILRLVGALRRYERFDRAFQKFTRESKLGFVGLFAGVLIIIVATLAWLFEPQTFRDDWWNAVWWGVVTVSTVGYGDFFPVTTGGRLVAMVLMFVGVALIGTFAATLSSFLVESRFQNAPPASPAAPAGDAPLPGFAIASELERLARLHREGALSDDEYTRAKRRLLD